ncbi:MAG: uncharacterized protein QOI74_3648 [Micromonosporaceae bacterium]|jgi:hypothetical protein|nr:uncharacterized protein [Micromonosporaceae bacterium]
MTAQQMSVLVRELPGKGRGVFAARSFTVGERVIAARTTGVSRERTRLSFQTDWDRHVDLDEPVQLVNHSCVPNTAVADNAHGGYDLVAIRPIAVGEELGWDYESTEYEIVGMDQCLCGASACRGRPRGFRYRVATGPALAPAHVAPYLRAAAAAAWPEAVTASPRSSASTHTRGVGVR